MILVRWITLFDRGGKSCVAEQCQAALWSVMELLGPAWIWILQYPLHYLTCLPSPHSTHPLPTWTQKAEYF